MADSENQRRGAAVRRQLLGDAWVEQTTRTTYADPVMRTFIDTVTETVFGALWTRPGLDLKTRTLICVVSDAATHFAELYTAAHVGTVKATPDGSCTFTPADSSILVEP